MADDPNARAKSLRESLVDRLKAWQRQNQTIDARDRWLEGEVKQFLAILEIPTGDTTISIVRPGSTTPVHISLHLGN